MSYYNKNESDKTILKALQPNIPDLCEKHLTNHLNIYLQSFFR